MTDLGESQSWEPGAPAAEEERAMKATKHVNLWIID